MATSFDMTYCCLQSDGWNVQVVYLKWQDEPTNLSSSSLITVSGNTHTYSLQIQLKHEKQIDIQLFWWASLKVEMKKK